MFSSIQVSDIEIVGKQIEIVRILLNKDDINISHKVFSTQIVEIAYANNIIK